MSALQRLLGPRRVRFFVDYLGRLRISSFQNRTSVDAYPGASNTAIRETQRVSAARGLFSQLIPQGNYYATRWAAKLMDRIGRRTQHVDYSTSSSDMGAYADALVPLEQAAEEAEQRQFVAKANWAIEREDVLDYTNTQDGTTQAVIVNDLKFDYDLTAKDEIAKMMVGLRTAPE